jgi:hypothetical protein
MQVEPTNTKHPGTGEIWATMRDEVSRNKPEAYLWDLAHDGVQLAQDHIIGKPMLWGVKRNGCGTHLFADSSDMRWFLSKEVFTLYRLIIKSHDSCGYPQGTIEVITYGDTES